MPTSWTPQNKSSTSWTLQNKNSASWAEVSKSGVANYLLTANSDYILLGTGENETLILDEANSWTAQNKS